ncbi:MAG: hypothetical protein EZS28_041854 [Streblomastix strix]|uniref:Uncharacterized protein n=1 Tax=Streblomastix strix TaxID=222440 RepID=A0A5J4TXL1_9EUKA|nr:MAG: hypothetical protein EZS28_041854 [Streblomastix strix]
MPHLPSHKIDIKTAQRTQQNRGYDLVRDPRVIEYKNSKQQSKLATQKPFTFRKQVSQPSGRDQKNSSLRQKRKRNKGGVVAAVAAATTAGKYKKIGQGKETKRFREPMEMKTEPIGYKEKESERKQPKLQQKAGLMDLIERFNEIMKPIIEEQKKKLKIIIPRQYKEHPNNDGPDFFYPPKNYHLTSIPRPKDLNFSEKLWNQFDGDVREGVVPFCL